MPVKWEFPLGDEVRPETRRSGSPAYRQFINLMIRPSGLPIYRNSGQKESRTSVVPDLGWGWGYSCIAPTTPIAEPIGAPPALRQHDTDRRRAPNETGSDALRRAWPIS
jgi:hypothetical protein